MNITHADFTRQLHMPMSCWISSYNPTSNPKLSNQSLPSQIKYATAASFNSTDLNMKKYFFTRSKMKIHMEI